MGSDKLTGIDFGNVKYTVTKAKGNDQNGKFTVDGYQVKLENGISFFMRKDSIQKGASISVDNDASRDRTFKNNVKFSGFKNITIFGSQDKDQIIVDNGSGVRVRTDNDNTYDRVLFTNETNQNNSWVGSKHDLRTNKGGTIVAADGLTLEYQEKYDRKMDGKDQEGYELGIKKYWTT